MIKKLIFVLALFLPLISQAELPEDIEASLLGSWNVVALKPGGQGDFVPPLQPGKWEFTSDGQLKEELGNNGATLIWKYSVDGDEISISIGGLAFRWKVISLSDEEMIVNHHIGIFKVRRL